MASANFLDEEEEASGSSSLYAVLNVPRDAPPEDITRAYRKLAQVFHPDKHVDEAKRRAAQESFAKVQEAYEVLSDSQKRQVYDVYGKAGLAAGGKWCNAREWTEWVRWLV
jgi:DnaJ-class molecular chaperone